MVYILVYKRCVLRGARKLGQINPGQRKPRGHPLMCSIWLVFLRNNFSVIFFSLQVFFFYSTSSSVCIRLFNIDMLPTPFFFSSSSSSSSHCWGRVLGQPSASAADALDITSILRPPSCWTIGRGDLWHPPGTRRGRKEIYIRWMYVLNWWNKDSNKEEMHSTNLAAIGPLV